MRRPKSDGERRELIEYIDSRLLEEYGDKIPSEPRPDPLDELVLTILSQNTNDVNRDRAYNKLRGRFPKWEDVLDAPVEKIEDAIRVGGLAGQKSTRIKRILGEIKEREGKLNLSRLCSVPNEEALGYLYSFKGVGEKTAAIVMLFCCDVPVFPVDTHIHRLSGRLGLIGLKDDAAKAHRKMGKLVPENIMYRFHINLIEHGRARCSARKPDCAACCLTERCPSSGKV